VRCAHNRSCTTLRTIPPRTNNWKLTPWTGGAGPIDPATAWPCDRVQVLQWVPAEYLRPVSRPGSGWIDRRGARGPGDRFLLTIPECMHISSRWPRPHRTAARRRHVYAACAASASQTGSSRVPACHAPPGLEQPSRAVWPRPHGAGHLRGPTEHCARGLRRNEHDDDAACAAGGLLLLLHVDHHARLSPVAR
jgi:hypothetical protein